jgi:hypothetical protein
MISRYFTLAVCLSFTTAALAAQVPTENPTRNRTVSPRAAW